MQHYATLWKRLCIVMKCYAWTCWMAVLMDSDKVCDFADQMPCLQSKIFFMKKPEGPLWRTTRVTRVGPSPRDLSSHRQLSPPTTRCRDAGPRIDTILIPTSQQVEEPAQSKHMELAGNLRVKCRASPGWLMAKSITYARAARQASAGPGGTPAHSISKLPCA